MGEHSLKSLARLADRVSALEASLSSAQATLLRSAISRAVEGADPSAEGLMEIFAESEAEEENDQDEQSILGPVHGFPPTRDRAPRCR